MQQMKRCTRTKLHIKRRDPDGKKNRSKLYMLWFDQKQVPVHIMKLRAEESDIHDDLNNGRKKNSGNII